MSRWAVAYVFPLFMIPMWFVRAVLIFRRGSIANKVKFNKWIDDEWGKSTQTALGVYPEGHRSTNGESLPLKRGMLHYAYDRKIPVQIVIGGNKEAILSEKKMLVGFGQTVTVGYSDVIYPENFKDFEEFMKAVQSTWDAEWVEVFSADWKGTFVMQRVRCKFQFLEFMVVLQTSMSFLIQSLSGICHYEMH